MPSMPHPRKKSVIRSRDASSTRPSSWKGVGAIRITPLISLGRTKMFLPLFWTWTPDLRSDAGDEATVDANDRPGHVGCPLARQERDHVGVFLRITIAPERDGPRALGAHLLDGAVLALGLGLIQEQDPLRRDATGQHVVGGDPIAPNLPRQRLRPADQRQPQRI